MPKRIVSMGMVLLVSADLAAAGPTDRVRFVVVGDYQPTILRNPDAPWLNVFPGMLREFGTLDPRPDFLIFVGDIVDGHGPAARFHCQPETYDVQYEHFLGVLRTNLDPHIPFYPVVGNHDYHRLRDPDGNLVDVGPQKFAHYMYPLIPPNASPKKRPYYSFRRGGTLFVVVCTGLFGVSKVKDYHDLVHGQQYEWLAGVLKAAAADPQIKHILVFGHHSFHALVNGRGDWSGLVQVQERIWRGLFVKYGVSAYLHGHEQFYDRSTHEGVAMIDVGGAGALENPGHPELRVNHYAVVDVTGSRVEVTIRLPGRRLYERFDLADLRAGRLAAPQVALAARHRALRAGADDEFPPELVSFSARRKEALFTGRGPGHWDVAIRERGWILREADMYHMWFTGYDGTREGTKRLGYATSADGLKWTRHAGNPLSGEHWVEDMIVVKSAETYYMFAEGQNDLPHLFSSPDRVHWTRQGRLDIRHVDGTPLSPGPHGTPTVLVENGTWYLFYERADDGVWLATSRDLKLWTLLRDDPVLVPGPEEYDGAKIAVNQIVPYRGLYYAYYHGQGRKAPWKKWSTNIAVSSNLLQWKKAATNPLVRGNRSSGIVVHDGKSFRLYTMHDRVEVHLPLAKQLSQ